MHDCSSLVETTTTDAANPTGVTAGNNSFRGWILTSLICMALFAVTAPTLHRLDFFDGVEHINLATVLELRRDGHASQWLMPELERDPRTVKPPLTAWIAAAPVRWQTIQNLGAADAATRSAAFSRFVWECRWPTLVCTCIMLFGVFELGRILGGRGRSGDWQVGVLSVLVCASSLLLLRQGRRATTDLQLALWVTITNVFLAKLIIQRRPWLGSIGAGIALGLAIMSKGPHIAALQTIVPAALFALYAWRRSRNDAPHVADAPTSERNERPGFTLPLAVGALLALTIGLWWYAYVLVTVPGVWNTWFHEVTRIEANALKPDPIYQYGSYLLRFLLPWTAWMLLGVGYAVYELLMALPSCLDRAESGGAHAMAPAGGTAGTSTREACSNIVFALLALLVPLLVMSLFRERKERYLLPMIGPAAVMAAYSFNRFMRAGNRAAFLPRIANVFMWLAIVWLAVGVAVLGGARTKSFLRLDGSPWYTAAEAAAGASIGAVIIVAGFVASWRWRPAGVIAIVLAAWVGNEMQLRGYISGDADSDSRSERLLADRLWREYPGAVVYDSSPPTKYGNLSLPAIVLSLYFDRVVVARPQPLPSRASDGPIILLTEASGQKPPILARGWRRLAVLPLTSDKQYVDILSQSP